MGTADDASAARESLETEIRRVADRLRSLPGPRIEPHLPGLRAAAQSLIDCAVSCAGASDRPPRGRVAPEVQPHAWGDVIAVLGNDVITACIDCDDDQATGQLQQAAAALGQLRRSL